MWDSLLFIPYYFIFWYIFPYTVFFNFQTASWSRMSPYCPFVEICGSIQNSKLLKWWYNPRSNFVHIHKSLNAIVRSYSFHRMKNRFLLFLKFNPFIHRKIRVSNILNIISNFCNFPFLLLSPLTPLLL